VLSVKKRGADTSEQQTLPLEKCLAKTVTECSGAIGPGNTVLTHTTHVGLVARELVQRLPQWLREYLYPEGCELVAACHDVGKVSPTFQRKIYAALTNHPLPTVLQTTDATLERGWGGHAGCSQFALEAIVADRRIALVAGQHHGSSPGKRLHANDAVLGGSQWQQQREELIRALKSALGCDWPTIKNDAQALALAGLTTIADWIGSGEYFTKVSDNEISATVETAVNSAGFIPPQLQPDLTFADLFGFAPHTIQSQFYEQVRGPGIYLLEAPMGHGKTEAALYAAYRMMAAGEATGIYFALPTQLTSNKIHERVNQYLDSILKPDSANRKSLLLHGQSWLTATTMGEAHVIVGDMGAEGAPGSSWFEPRKRSILAPFGVGTLDQALLAVMNVRHGFVRAFGLAGKVVILDEIHSYDIYTGTLIDRLLEILTKLHCTVIILSATLTQQRRSELLQAPVNANGYPLISAKSHTGTVTETATVIESCATTYLHYSNQDSALDETLRRASEGQKVLWIENSVAEAQQIYRLLTARASGSGISCGLLHSRFTFSDRQQIETDWVGRFGKAGRSHPPLRGEILIGTQVLEQSLDIDADFLISRFAPSDMLLQRMGRLWRHQTAHRPATARREAWLLAPNLNAALATPHSEFGPTARIYHPYILCRSLEVWQSLTTLTLPHDIRQIIDSTYHERDETGDWARWASELEHGNRYHKGRQALQGIARLALGEIGKAIPEEMATTRYSEQDNTDILILRAVHYDEARQLHRLTLIDGELLELPDRPANRSQQRQLAALLQQQIVSVAPHHAPQKVNHSQYKWLRPWIWLGGRDQDEASLRVALVGEDARLTLPDGTTAHGKWQLNYNSQLGYQNLKIDDPKEG
jgi:CRISPR-associated endonuclease/helicase Cas3